MWLWLSVSTALSWALGSVLLKPAYKKLSIAQVYALNGLSFFLLWIFYAILTSAPILIPKNFFLILPILSPLAFITFIFAIKEGKVSIVSALSSTSPLVSTTLAIIFLDEKITRLQAVCTFMIVVSLVLLGLIEKGVKRDNNMKGFGWGLATALGFGTANAGSKLVLNRLGVVSFSLINGTWMLILSFLWLAAKNQLKSESWSVLESEEGKRGIIGSIIYSLGGFFLFLALQRSLVSLVIPVTTLATPFTMILAAIFLKEKMKPAQRLLIGLIFLTTACFSML